MLKGMLRFRRYRVFLIFAAIITLLIVRISHSRDWVQTPPTPALDFNSSPKNNAGSAPEKYPAPNTSNEQSKETVEPQSPDRISTSAKKEAGPSSTPTTKSTVAAVETVPTVILPDRKPVVPDIVYSNEDEVVDELHPVAPPGRQEPIVLASPVPTTIHWEKQIQHFPVPTESIIRLPTGSPLKIAKIQHNFNDETSDAKITREKRQSKVKEEFLRSWTGYKKNAWLHDELSPVSGKFRDPFCGWAATLVDTLDTLWIMGLEAQFEEAAKAVDLIDFTTSPRQDIPMFETTIRYLGGLLAAYDVSGGRYKNLLDKAVELAEVLIGAFDTPNRMPVLYYRWKPTFASQPHRASQRSNLAELGSLSMEFTRLAQLTKDPKYYDAIARVTNALFEWQERGTKLDGLFPENVDASGCNRTVAQTNQEPISNGQEPAIIPVKSTEEPVGFVPVSPDPVKEPKPKKKKQKFGSGPPDLEFQILPGEPTKGEIIGWGGDGKKQMKRDSVGWGAEAKKPMKRDRTDNVTDSLTNHLIVSKTAAATPTPNPTIDPITGLPLDIPAAKKAIGAGVGDWDCVAQGLVSAAGYGLGDKFSMGGGQDSTYEYFLKQHLLLGGLEDKYSKLYLKTIDAVRKWLLFRPMLPDNPDILFSGSVSTNGNPEEDLVLSAEVNHLTCFIGGMVGMGARVFGNDGDLEIAKKLADGCVWAYGATSSGIMPEGASVYPCRSAEHCTWNETAYWEFLDPMGPTRDRHAEEYLIAKANRQEEAEIAAFAAGERAEAEKMNAEDEANMSSAVSDEDIEAAFNTTDPAKGTASLKNEKPISLEKRQGQSSPKEEVSKPIAHNFQDDLPKIKAESSNSKAQTGAAKASPSSELKPKSPAQALYEQKSQHTEAELKDMATSGRQADSPLSEVTPQGTGSQTPLLPDPLKPLTHKEYVEARIKQEGLPPGFVSLRSKKYILRPEAIESVWYMYRITGDSSWQDKGWTMFEAIIQATSTQFGHSAVYDVTVPEPYQVDEMESFWLAETLKYFYLLYSTPETISLDEWVFNTEAHPFKRPA